MEGDLSIVDSVGCAVVIGLDELDGVSCGKGEGSEDGLVHLYNDFYDY